MVKCPNVNSPQFKELVEKTDLQTAYRVFMENGDSVPFLGTRDSNYLLDNLTREFSVNKTIKNKEGKLLKVEPRSFNRVTVEELVADIRNSYSGDYTVNIVSTDENNNSIKVEGYPIPVGSNINEVMYTSLNEDWNINTKYEQRPSVQFYNLERGKHLYEEYNLLNKDGQIKTVPYNTVEDKRKTNEWVETLNKSPYYYFEVRNTTTGYKILVADKQTSTRYEQRLDYGLKVINALNKLQRNKFDINKLQGWVNDLSKQGVTKEQIDIFKNSAKEGMTKEEIISSVAANYSYSVEVNTAKTNEDGQIKQIGDNEEFSFNGSIYEYKNDEYLKDNDIIDIIEYETAKNDAFTRPNTSYYSNLTVPGGTNYTENEISTPLITPSIKGHAQFSTDQGIGWFRSDEQVTNGKIYNVESDASADNIEYIDEEGQPVYKSFPKTFGGETTKTRRILEIQSDLFQKGRDRKELIPSPINFDNKIKLHSELLDSATEDEFNNSMPYNNGIKLKTEPFVLENYGRTAFYKVGDTLFFKGWGNKYYKVKEDKLNIVAFDENKNKFLQLLNKDSNWVTFFIKSIIQDSAKKGYEKVLFPKGETAAKIEGHETIAEEIKVIDKQLEDVKNTKGNVFNSNENYYAVLDGNIFKTQQETIEFLEARKQELKSQGVEKLKPIEAFYEIRVGNILEKQFGKDNVKTTTDEYGNQWREIAIDLARDLNSIELQRQFTPFMDKAEQEAKSLKQSERRIEINKQKERLLKVFPQVKEIIEDYNMPQLGTLEAGNTIIRINPDLMRDDTLLHEFGHLLIDLMGGMQNDLIFEARKALVGSNIEKSVLQRYPELIGTETFAKEVVAQALGEDAAKVWDDEYKRYEWENVLRKILNFLKELVGINRSEIRRLTRTMLKGTTITGETFNTAASDYVQEQRDTINTVDGQTIINAIKELSSAIEFDEATHTYTLEGEKLDAVSTLMAEVGYGIRKEDENPTIQRGQKIGTTVHKNAEAISNDVKDIVTVDSGFEMTQKAHDDLKGILNGLFGEKYTMLNEAIIVDAEAKVAGTADVVAINDKNDIFIFDFKTKEGSKKGFKYYDSNTFGRTQREKNTLQLSLYKQMLKRSLGLNVKGLYIVPLVIDVNKYDKITAISLDKSLSVDGTIELQYNPLAADILAKNEAKNKQKEVLTAEDLEIDENTVEYKSAQIVDNSLDKYQRMYQEAVDTFTSRLGIARTRNKQSEVQALESLLFDMDIAKADPKRGIGLFVKEAVSHMNSLWNLYLEREEKERSGQENVWSPESLMYFNESLSVYDMLEDVVGILLTEGNGLTNSTTSKYKRIIEDTISKKNKLRGLYKDKGVKILSSTYYPLIKRVIKEEERQKMEEWNKQNADKIRTMSTSEVNEARNVYAKQFVTDNYPEILQLTKLRFEQELLKAHEDVGYLTRWLESLLNTNDMVVAGMVKDFAIQYNKGRIESIEVRDEMLDKLRDLEKALNYKASTPVEKLYDWMLEKDDKGKYTGHILTKFNSTLLNMMNQMLEDTKNLPKGIKAKKREEWRKKYGFSTDWKEYNKAYLEEAESLAREGILSSEELKAVKQNEEMSYVYQVEIIKLVNHEAADRLIKWRQNNRLTYMFVSEGTEYDNKEWKELEKILKNPEDPRTKWYNFIVDMSDKADSYLPDKSKLRSTLPAIFKDFVESVQSGNDVSSIIKEHYSQNLLKHPNDIDRGQLDESTSSPIFFLPTFYTRGGTYDVNKQSYDLATIYYNFYRMATDYRYKNEIIGNMELTKKFITERKYTLRDRKGNPIKKMLDDRREKELTKSGQTSLLAAQVEDFFRMQIYGQKTVDLGEWEVLGLKIDKVKAIEMINKYTALNMLGLNFVQGFANISFGEIQNITEIVGGDYIGIADMQAASKVYFKPSNHMEMIGDVGSRKPASLVNILNEKWDILNEYEGGIYRKSTKFAQLMSTNSLFFTSRMGEHFMQSRVMLAMLNRIEAKDKDGNILGTMLEMYSTKDGKLILNDKVDLINSNWTAEQQILFGEKAKRLLSIIHGEYSELGKIAIQRHVVGRTALMFRKFMVPGYKKRWGDLAFNEFLEEWTAGSYRQTGRFLRTVIKDLATLKLALVQEEFKKLMPYEQANIRRALTEVMFMLAMVVLGFTFTSLAGEADDDREKWIYDFLTYQAHRTRAELSFFWNPAEAINILGSPAASISIIEDIISLIGQMTSGPFDKYERGNWKGRYKMSKKLMKFTPGLKQWYRLRDIEDFTKIFQFN